MSKMLVKHYNLLDFPFPLVVERILGQRLSYLIDPAQSWTHDQDSLYHQKIYQGLDAEFNQLYARFVEKIVSEDLPHHIAWSVQRIPTFRFQYPKHRGTKEFHRDRDYAHSVDTLNVVVPLTEMRDTTAIRVEVAPYTDHYVPMTASPGQYILFDGANTKHGTVVNREGYTRVSFDFRLLPTSSIPEGTTVTHRVPFHSYYRTVECS
jgi:hypothetical protein